jgi:hypothetical protein
MEITPPLRKDQKVQCSVCNRMSNDVKADVDAPPFTFVCVDCEDPSPKWRGNEARVLRNL